MTRTSFSWPKALRPVSPEKFRVERDATTCASSYGPVLLGFLSTVATTATTSSASARTSAHHVVRVHATLITVSGTAIIIARLVIALLVEAISSILIFWLCMTIAAVVVFAV